MSRPFLPGDRVITKHGLDCYNNRRGTVVKQGFGRSILLTIDNPSEEIKSFADLNLGLIYYSDCYLVHADPLTPFEEAVQSYIRKELHDA